MANGLKNSPLVPMLLGGGVASGVAIAARQIPQDGSAIQRWSSLIGLGAGILVGGALAIPKRTRGLGINTLVSAILFGANNVANAALLPAGSPGALRSLPGAGAAAGVTTVQRVRQFGQGQGRAGVEVMGRVQLAPANRQNIPYSGTGPNRRGGAPADANVTSMFGAVPLAGVN